LSGVPGRPTLVFSFDLEDWHQIVHRDLGIEGWNRPRPEFGRQMRAVFELLEEVGARSTFFALGMCAEQYPEVVADVVERGHEIACHGYAHERVFEQTPDEFRTDVERCVTLIEQICGRRPLGFRAPAFSIGRRSAWAYEVLADLGFRYDSSQYDSPRVGDRLRGIPAGPYRLQLASGRELLEFPIAVYTNGRRTLPIGGGSYWRLLPQRLLHHALVGGGATRSERVLYFHPYECDPVPLAAELPLGATPRQRLAASSKRLYWNLGRAGLVAKIRALAGSARLVTFEELLADVDQRASTRPRALSREGALV
jgi:polysaccharide deacetylase family protein (PEP-CTERM system associated)